MSAGVVLNQSVIMFLYIVIIYDPKLKFMYLCLDVVIMKNTLQILQQRNIYNLIQYIVQGIIANVCAQCYLNWILGEKENCMIKDNMVTLIQSHSINNNSNSQCMHKIC